MLHQFGLWFGGFLIGMSVQKILIKRQIKRLVKDQSNK